MAIDQRMMLFPKPSLRLMILEEKKTTIRITGKKSLG